MCQPGHAGRSIWVDKGCGGKSMLGTADLLGPFMQKSQDKLRKLVILLITWALLLGFFLAYDTYFVASQKEFLVDREFRTLAAMSRKIRAEFDRARLSAESGVKLAAPAHPGYAADIKCGARSIAECRREYIDLYLNEILVREDSPADVP